MTITFLVLAGVVVVFVVNRLPVELVALASALTLYATGVLDLDEILAGFGDPAVLLIASLFVVSEGLDATGVMTWAGQQLMQRTGEGGARLVLLVLGLVAVLTAFISVNGAVAALVPMVVIVAVRTGRPASQLLMPLAFGAHAGSMLALTGTPVNVLVSEAAYDAGAGRFGFFSFALAGIPLVAGTMAVVALFGDRLLPDRSPKSLPPDLSDHARTLGLQYVRSHRAVRLVAGPGAPGTPDPADPADPGDPADLRVLDETDGVTVVGVQAGGKGGLTPATTLHGGDVVIVRGDPLVVAAAATRLGLVLDDGAYTVDDLGTLITRDVGVAEVVIPPRSALIGERVFPGMVTDSGDLVVLSVQRRGDDLGADEVALAPGDVLLVQGEWDALEHHVSTDPGVLIVDPPDRVRRQAVPMGQGSRRAMVIVGLMVVAMATGVVPSVIAGLVAASAMVLFRVLSTEQAYRGISWTTIVLVGAMIPLSTAMTKTGAAERVATGLVDLIGDAGPYALLVGLFVLTVTLGQLISNMATALIVIPIAISAAGELGVSVQPVMMCVTVAAAAALLTPVATPANLMVMGPGGYRFGDYWKLGLPLLVLYFLVSVVLVPVVWSF